MPSCPRTQHRHRVLETDLQASGGILQVQVQRRDRLCVQDHRLDGSDSGRRPVVQGQGGSVVLRFNGRRAIEAECDPDPDNDCATPDKVVSSIRKDIESIERPEGYGLRWIGDMGIQNEAINNILKYIPLTLFLMLGMLTLGGQLPPMVRLFVLLFTAAGAGVPCERLLFCSIIDLV